MPRVIHFEIPSDDPPRAIAFYGAVFGWTCNAFVEGEYWMCTTGGDEEKGIDGGIMKRKAPGQPVANTILVDSVDEFNRKIVAAGGEVVVPKMEIPTMGFLSYFKDLDGNIFGIAEMS